jgi:hypothetical protein
MIEHVMAGGVGGRETGNEVGDNDFSSCVIEDEDNIDNDWQIHDGDEEVLTLEEKELCKKRKHEHVISLI